MKRFALPLRLTALLAVVMLAPAPSGAGPLPHHAVAGSGTGGDATLAITASDSPAGARGYGVLHLQPAPAPQYVIVACIQVAPDPADPTVHTVALSAWGRDGRLYHVLIEDGGMSGQDYMTISTVAGPGPCGTGTGRRLGVVMGNFATAG